mgnify:CR=1 FL=1
MDASHVFVTIKKEFGFKSIIIQISYKKQGAVSDKKQQGVLEVSKCLQY